jgi:hypothetical protein
MKPGKARGTERHLADGYSGNHPEPELYPPVEFLQLVEQVR